MVGEQKTTLTLGELLLKATNRKSPAGNINGVCVVCERYTEKGVPLKECVSDNFTGWSNFFSGNCMCPECAFLFSDQTFRRKSWVASIHGFHTFKNDEALQVLFNPPEPPFFIYIAKAGQKQSWLSSIHRIAYDSSKYFFSHERYDVPILFEKKKAEQYITAIEKAMSYGISKTELTTVEFKMKTWQKAYEEGYHDFLKKLTKFKNDILWEVLVDVFRRKD